MGGAGRGHHRTSLAAHGSAFTKQDFTLDLARLQVTCPGGPRVPLVPGRHVQCPAAACEACALRAQCTTAARGQGRRLSIREDAQCQQKLRAKMKTQRGRASLRKRTAVAQAISHQLAHQGRAPLQGMAPKSV